jgi:hypothetical protein
VDFSLTDEQELVRSTARTMLAHECPPALVRAHGDDPAVGQPFFEAQLRDWVPLSDGPLVDLCLFLEEAGAVLAPGPFLCTTALFVPMLRVLGDPCADEAAAGTSCGTVAMAGRSGRWEVSDDPVRTFVMEVDQVDQAVIVGAGPALAVVDAGELVRRPVATLDTTRRLFEVDVPPRLSWAGVDPAGLDRVIQRATVALAAELVGTARWMVDATVGYAREREQFGRPIGSFQGLQFALVDLALDYERAQAAVYYAAMALDADDPDARRATHVAKAAAGTAARHAARRGMQIHGGIGYTWEHDLHLYLRRAYATDDLLGDAAHHHDRLAALLFDS